jgi:hypothetical protein
MGFALFGFFPEEYRKEHAQEFLYISPGLGGLTFGALAYIFLIFNNTLNFSILLVAVALVFVGLWQVRKYYRHAALKRELKFFITFSLLIIVISGFPFLNHIAPPDVDAMFFSYISFLIKTNRGFPLTNLWPNFNSLKYFVPTAANANIVAMFSGVTNVDLALASLYFAVFWVTATLLIATTLIRRIVPSLASMLVLLCLLFAFNSAFIWEYGDGAYSRVPGTCAVLLIAYLCSKLAEYDSKKSFLLIGVVHAFTLYFHYRLFIWNSVILAVWMIYYVWQSRKSLEALRTLLIPVTSCLFALPLLICNLPVIHKIITTSAVVATEVFNVKHQLSSSDLFHQFLRFQGWILHSLTVIGMLIYFVKSVRKKERNSLLDFAMIYYCVMLFFCFDTLVLSIFPFTYNILYSQMAIISNFSLSKLVFGTYLTSELLKRLESSTIRDRYVIFSVLAICVAIWCLILIRLISDNPWVFKGLKLFLQFLPNTFGTEYVYAIVALACSVVLFGRSFFFIRKEQFALLCVCAWILLLASYEMSNSRFNYPYLTSEDKEAYLWFKSHSNAKTTLILTASTRDISNDREIKNALSVFPHGNRPTHWGLHWLPVVSERASVFSRAQMVIRINPVFLNIKGRDPEFEDLDWAYWHPENPRSLEILYRNHITHIFFPARFHQRLSSKLETNSHLREVYESQPIEDFRGATAAIYEVVQMTSQSFLGEAREVY